MKWNSLWVIDVEGNGRKPPAIVELAMWQIKNFTLSKDHHHWRVKPDQPISHIVTRIHGISNADVANAPSIRGIAKDVLGLLGNAAIVGHNVRVELDILRSSFHEWNPVAAVDTLTLAKMLRPGLPSYSLKNLGEHFGHLDEAATLSGGKAHSAVYDAALTALIFLDLMSSVSDSRKDSFLQEVDLLDDPQLRLL